MSSSSALRIVVVGGGAAGFFAAITAKENNPDASVVLLEKTSQQLAKVRISGGGRCNVTHACFDPLLLTKNYPRGNKALIGPFHKFQPRDTIEWFESRGVELKTEADGRMFPASNTSQSIITCLMNEAEKNGVVIRLKQRLQEVSKANDLFQVILASGETLTCERLLIATGNSSEGHALAKSLGHSIHSPVPSLFTFNCPTSPLLDLSGIVVPNVEISVAGSSLMTTGPLLLTHWGFSGPAALKLSAWSARLLHEKEYRVSLTINWLPAHTLEALQTTLLNGRKERPQNNLCKENPFTLPKNLWNRLLELQGFRQGFQEGRKVGELSNDDIQRLVQKLHGDSYEVNGKTTNKEEFVTCGGVDLDEVHFKTMESRICPGLFFAGEVLDIDAVTGGFNFQNAWTTGWLAGNAIAH